MHDKHGSYSLSHHNLLAWTEEETALISLQPEVSSKELKTGCSKSQRQGVTDFQSMSLNNFTVLTLILGTKSHLLHSNATFLNCSKTCTACFNAFPLCPDDQLPASVLGLSQIPAFLLQTEIPTCN